MKDLVTIIVPVFNAGLYLDRCIKSVLEQSYKEIELILINDGSTDKSDDICKYYSSKDSRIVYISQVNSGVSKTRNLGIKKAHGKYLFFLDSDDYIDKDVIKTLINYSTDERLVGICFKKIYKDKESIIKYNKYNYLKNNFCENIILGQLPGYSCGYLFLTDVCKKKLFCEDIFYCEDMVFVFNYIRNSNVKEIVFSQDNCYYNYVFNNFSITVSSDNVLAKIDSINKALDIVDSITENKYAKLLSDKKIRLIEAELQKTNINSYILDKVELKKYNAKNIRYKFFSYVYRKKYINLIKFYYYLRKRIKSFKR